MQLIFDFSMMIFCFKNVLLSDILLLKQINIVKITIKVIKTMHHIVLYLYTGWSNSNRIHPNFHIFKRKKYIFSFYRA